jgi:hypothetical protein
MQHELFQSPYVLVCPQCPNKTWAADTAQAVLQRHVRLYHPLTYATWIGQAKDLRELRRLFLLDDDRP